MTLIKDQEELDQLLNASEAITRGESPDQMAGTGGPAPAASENGEDASPSASSPAPYAEVADLLLLLVNGGYMLAFGPRGILPPNLQQEAKKNLELICAKYLPSTLGSFGPETALAGVLLVHTVHCYQVCRTNVPLPGSSANAAAASQP